MATAVLPYSAAHYNSLPALHDAKSTFDIVDAAKALDSKIGAIFVRHGVQDTLGITLLHTHFALEGDERLVTFGSVAVPVALEIDVGSAVKPLLYRFLEDGVAVYEWVQGDDAPEIDLDDDKCKAFMQELRAALQECGLLNVLGLCVQQRVGEKGMEFTAGRANVTLPVNEIPGDDTSIEAVWTFSVKGSGQVLAKTGIWCTRGVFGVHNVLKDPHHANLSVTAVGPGPTPSTWCSKGVSGVHCIHKETARLTSSDTGKQVSEESDGDGDVIPIVNRGCCSSCMWKGGHHCSHGHGGCRRVEYIQYEGADNCGQDACAMDSEKISEGIVLRGGKLSGLTLPTITRGCRSWCSKGQVQDHHYSWHNAAGPDFETGEAARESLSGPGGLCELEGAPVREVSVKCTTSCRSFVGGEHSKKHDKGRS